MINLYNQLKEKLVKIDFNELWPGFHSFKFALYDDKTVYLDGLEFKTDNRFIGNTAIKFNDEYIAIWNVDLNDNYDIDIFASKIIHEMFHAYQMASNETRWPNEIIDGLGYDYSTENLSVKLQENRVLVGLFNDFCEMDYEQFLLLRRYRQKHYKKEFEYETKIEVIEGMAEYIELKALKKLSDYKYHQTLETLKKEISDYSNLIPIRTICYHIGALLMTLCDQNKISFEHQIGNTNQTVFDILSKGIVYSDLKHSTNKDIEALVSQYYDDLDRTISNFMNNAEQHIDGSFKICGLDPQNTKKLKNKLYCKNFIVYLDDSGAPEFINKECVVLLDEKYTISEIYF